MNDRKVRIAAGRDCTAKGAGTISQVANIREENFDDKTPRYSNGAALLITEISHSQRWRVG